MLRKWIYIQDISPFKYGDIIEVDETMHIVNTEGMFKNKSGFEKETNFKYFLTTLTYMNINMYEYIMPLDLWREKRIDDIIND